jgi:hypothetical protein
VTVTIIFAVTVTLTVTVMIPGRRARDPDCDPGRRAARRPHPDSVALRPGHVTVTVRVGLRLCSA